ncbi:putative cytochrome P450 [Lentithecium fluviatile CBS 122367]|uniref:Putative cytochrome P450 n=1 Tax=Lentithecium fluviatile CBS 122367 TaxID=1168545 RepID=A0A6G1JAV5_9PLEO|nr:putative cytochrome P450 [Lentithecium fluviatile CBS 122367]
MASYISLVALVFASFTVLTFAIYLFTPPRNFPRNIPTIPFYYALLPLFKDLDQANLYRGYLKEPLEKYGVVKIFFGGRWNILIRKPSYVAEMFKFEEIYAKSGNQVKIPHSLVAQYTGENIISSHGQKWKDLTAVIKPALQYDQDPSVIWRNSRILKDILLQGSKTPSGGVAVYGPLQRYALANLSEILFESSFGTLQRPDAPLHALQMKIKPAIFNPIFMNFPFLDHFKLKSRLRAMEVVRYFRSTLTSHIANGHKHVCDLESTNLACRLLGSHREGILSKKDLHDNLVASFLAGHENPQLALISIMYLLGKNVNMQERVRSEINSLYAANAPDSFEPLYTEIHDLPLLTSVIYETLRLFPPISQLLNRRTKVATVLGDNIAIPQGVYVGYNAYSTNRDIDFWGLDADIFKPERWGSNKDDINHKFRRANAKGAFISFHGGRRACIGQKWAMEELRITMVEILRGLRWTLDKSWDGRMTPAGPLYPRNLKIKFEALKE